MLKRVLLQAMRSPAFAIQLVDVISRHDAMMATAAVLTGLDAEGVSSFFLEGCLASTKVGQSIGTGGSAASGYGAWTQQSMLETMACQCAYVVPRAPFSMQASQA